MLRCKGVQKRFGERVVLKPFDLELGPGQRLGIVGRNGAGKTTLVKLCLGELQPDQGTVAIGPTVAFAAIDQARSALSPEKTVLEEVAHGNDYVVVWDAEDNSSDVFIKAGILSCRYLCVRGARQSAAQQVDFETIDKAICEIEKRAGNLDEVRKAAETIQSSSGKILDRIRLDRESLEKQVELLRDRVTDLKNTVATPQ